MSGSQLVLKGCEPVCLHCGPTPDEIVEDGLCESCFLRARRIWSSEHKAVLECSDFLDEVERKEKRYLRDKEWRARNPERWLELTNHASQMRRSRIHSLPNTLTAEQWKAIKKAYKGRCAYCGKKCKRLEKEHVIPVVQGGGYTADNIVPACRSCNTKKNRYEPSLVPPKRLLL